MHSRILRTRPSGAYIPPARSSILREAGFAGLQDFACAKLAKTDWYITARSAFYGVRYMKRIQSSGLTVLIVFALLLAALVLCSCGGAEGKETEEETLGPDRDIAAVAAYLESNGRTVTYYLQGSAMLEALDEEMDYNLDAPTEHPLACYLFAKNELQELDCEVFVFQTVSDAQKFYEHYVGGEQFAPGISDVRRMGKMVYMGYIEALDLIEKAD